jgi:hypothetical protein
VKRQTLMFSTSCRVNPGGLDQGNFDPTGRCRVVWLWQSHPVIAYKGSDAEEALVRFESLLTLGHPSGIAPENALPSRNPTPPNVGESTERPPLGSVPPN